MKEEMYEITIIKNDDGTPFCTVIDRVEIKCSTCKKLFGEKPKKDLSLENGIKLCSACYEAEIEKLQKNNCPHCNGTRVLERGQECFFC